ncbi:site-specific integrase [Raoultibacter massiliensis]|uniref:Site-specific integrase n=1 Tax=Raoultibacter massiliensis TaxID=1852371 RepID=A0ABV1JEC5_9ACTN
MPVYFNEENGTFFVQCYYCDGRGAKRHKVKRGFADEADAVAWEGDFLSSYQGTMDMRFSDFAGVYIDEIRPRIREHTLITKEYMIKDKIVPYFARMRMTEIEPIDIIRWQNKLIEATDKNGKRFSPTYLRTIDNQLHAIFNHAERYYNLAPNPASKVTKMGSKETKEMLFWTKSEYLKFSEAIMDKPLSYYAFEILYWCGIRLGELLALTKSDFNLEKAELNIDKSYQRLKGVDVITEPKTRKSVRVVSMPKFLVEEIQEYLDLRDDIGSHERLFGVTKSYLAHEMDRGCDGAGVKRIRIHDLRHSHVSLLIEMGFSALAIAERVGHEAVDITYRYAHLFPSKQEEMANALDLGRRE